MLATVYSRERKPVVPSYEGVRIACTVAEAIVSTWLIVRVGYVATTSILAFLERAFNHFSVFPFGIGGQVIRFW